MFVLKVCSYILVHVHDIVGTTGTSFAACTRRTKLKMYKTLVIQSIVSIPVAVVVVVLLVILLAVVIPTKVSAIVFIRRGTLVKFE